MTISDAQEQVICARPPDSTQAAVGRTESAIT
jgi:hypothetical protein